MTLDEAIMILILDMSCEFEGNSRDLVAALGLGLEALKAWEECRRKGMVPLGWVLPGETEDKGEQ